MIASIDGPLLTSLCFHLVMFSVLKFNLYLFWVLYSFVGNPQPGGRLSHKVLRLSYVPWCVEQSDNGEDKQSVMQVLEHHLRDMPNIRECPKISAKVSKNVLSGPLMVWYLVDHKDLSVNLLAFSKTLGCPASCQSTAMVSVLV